MPVWRSENAVPTTRVSRASSPRLCATKLPVYGLFHRRSETVRLRLLPNPTVGQAVPLTLLSNCVQFLTMLERTAYMRVCVC